MLYDSRHPPTDREAGDGERLDVAARKVPKARRFGAVLREVKLRERALRDWVLRGVPGKCTAGHVHRALHAFSSRCDGDKHTSHKSKKGKRFKNTGGKSRAKGKKCSFISRLTPRRASIHVALPPYFHFFDLIGEKITCIREGAHGAWKGRSSPQRPAASVKYTTSTVALGHTQA